MPIDTSIYSLLTPLKRYDPIESEAKMLSLKEMALRGQMGKEQLATARLQREEMERGVKEQEALRQVLTQNPNATDADLVAVSPRLAPAILKARVDFAKAKTDADKEALALKISKSKRRAQLLSSAVDQGTFEQALAQAVDEGVATPDEVKPLIGAQWVPEMKKAFDALALSEMTYAERAEMELKKQGAKRADEELNQRRQTAAVNEMMSVARANETARHNKAVEDRQALPNTPAELAIIAADLNTPPDRRAAAESALKTLERHAIASRPSVTVSGGGAPGATSNDPKDIAQAIVDGNQPPDLKALYRLGGPVRAELARKGFDLTTAQRDWSAIQRHISTLNGPQQERLRQAVNFTYDSLDQIEDLYKQWSQKGLNTRFKAFNKASLAAAKQLGGEAGSIAQNLETQINDLTSELGTVYKGGNASTDESLRLASENLKADWNEVTFRRALEQIRKNLQIRRNSILTSQPVGVSEGSRYAAPTPAAAPVAPQAQGAVPQVGGTFNGERVKSVTRIK